MTIWLLIYVFCLFSLASFSNKVFDPDSRGTSWVRYWRYASRVRTADYVDWRDPISNEVMAHLLQSLAQNSSLHLLPNLKTLRWSSARKKCSMQLFLWLSPSLQSLVLGIDEDLPIEPMSRMLDTLAASHLPRLRSLQVDAEFDLEEPTHRQVLGCIRSHNHIRFLSLPSAIPPGDLQGVLDLHHELQHLEVEFALSRSSESPFLVLASDRPSLRTLDIQLNGDAQIWGKENLTVDDIGPLFGCPGLETLLIYSEIPVVMRSQDALAMANAWPSLHTLVFNCRKAPQRTYGTPVEVLASLASAMGGSLRHLGLTLTFGGRIPKADEPLEAFSHLKVLCISGILGSREVAASVGEFLGALCGPGLSVHAFGALDRYQSGRYNPPPPPWYHDRPSGREEMMNWPKDWVTAISYMQAVQRARAGLGRYYEERQEQ